VVDVAATNVGSRTAVVAQNTLAQVIARVASMLASVAVIPILTRYLGPSLFGDYALVITLNAFLLSATDLGIQTVATRDASQAPEKMGLLAGQAVILRTLGTIVLAGASVGILSLTGYPQSVKLGFAIMALTVLFNALQTGFAVVLQSTLRLYLLGLSDVVGRLASTALIFVIIGVAVRLSLGQTAALQGIFWALVVGSLLSLVVCALLVRPRALSIRTFRPAIAWRMLRDSLPLGAVAVASLILYRSDTILLSVLRNAHDVGIYNLSYRFLDLLLAIPGLFMASVFPLLSAQVSDPATFRRIWQKALDSLALLGVPLAFGTFLTAPHLIRLFGGSQFAQSVEPLQILSFAVLLSYLDYAFPHALIIANRQAWILAIMVLGLSLNIGLNLIFIPVGSYNAAATVTVVSELVNVLLAYALAVRTYGYSLKFTTPLKSVVAGAAMFGLLYPFRAYNLALLVVAGVVIYAAGVLGLRAIDLASIRELFPRLR
jgi:O-antigen/teichoic acid export membrane protein